MRSAFILLTAICLALCAAPSHATSVTFDFEADFHSSSAALAALGVTDGTSIAGSFTFDDATPDLRPVDPFTAFYPDTVSAVSYVISGGVNFPGSAAGGNISVTDGDPALPATGQDAFTLLGNQQCAGSIGDYSLSFINIILTDTTATAFSNDHLPSTAPPVAEFDIPTVILMYRKGTASERAEFRMTSLTDGGQPQVPEPATIVLFGAGLLAGLIVRRRGRAA